MKLNDNFPARIIINGKIFDHNTAQISVLDRGFLFGDSLYEVLRTYNSDTIFQFERHYERLLNTSALMGLRLPFDKKGLLHEIYKAIEGLGAETYIRIIVSRGNGDISLDINESLRPNFIIIGSKYQPFPDIYYREGIDLYTPSIKRNPKNSLDPQIKSGNYLNNILALREAKINGYHDALMLNAAGFITELSTSNIFFVAKGLLKTPSEENGILKGVTRSFIMELCEKYNISYETGNYTISEVESAEECFVSSTLKEIMPVRKINDKIFKTIPGEVTSKLSKLYKMNIY